MNEWIIGTKRRQIHCVGGRRIWRKRKCPQLQCGRWSEICASQCVLDQASSQIWNGTIRHDTYCFFVMCCTRLIAHCTYVKWYMCELTKLRLFIPCSLYCTLLIDFLRPRQWNWFVHCQCYWSSRHMSEIRRWILYQCSARRCQSQEPRNVINIWYKPLYGMR